MTDTQTTPTETPAPATTRVHPETGIVHTAVETALGETPKSKKGKPTVIRSARWIFEIARKNDSAVVPVFSTQNIKPAGKDSKAIEVPVFSNVFRADLTDAEVSTLFGASVSRMAVDFANDVILKNNAANVRSSALKENPEYLFVKRFNEVKQNRIDNGKAVDSDWETKATPKIRAYVEQELAMIRAERLLAADDDEDSTDTDDADVTEETDETESAPQAVPPIRTVFTREEKKAARLAGRRK